MQKSLHFGACCVIGMACCGLLGAQAVRSDEIIGEVLASDASVQGAVVLASGGTSLLSGSTVEAGSTPVIVKLRRGGTVRVCPGSTLSMSAAQAQPQAQRGLMLSLDTGAIETGYELGAAADSLITPDFRILLSGPGAFHVAVGADAKGNTCVRSLPGNTAALVVSELMGTGSFQVKPQESVLFRDGHVGEAVADTEPCGCPAAPALEIAQEKKPVEPVTATPQESEQPAPVTPPAEPQALPALQPTETRAAPAAKPGQVQVQVDAPFVFSAVSPAPSVATVASLRLEPIPDIPEPEVVGPAFGASAAPSSPNKQQKKGFFGRLRSFFASIFGK